MLLRSFVLLVLVVALGACASTPTSRPGTAKSTGNASLRLCDGVKISNAPATDRTGHIIDYDSTATISGASLLRAPVDACVSSGYGPRKGGISSFHHGVDLYTRSPSPVYSGGDGVIVSIGSLSGYGKSILIRHGRGVETRYAHLSDVESGLREGAHVARGERIAMTGRTGNATAVHLHYEIIVDGRRHNPLTIGRRTSAADHHPLAPDPGQNPHCIRNTSRTVLRPSFINSVTKAVRWQSAKNHKARPHPVPKKPALKSLGQKNQGPSNRECRPRLRSSPT